VGTPPRPTESFVQRFRALAGTSAKRHVDFELRLFDVTLAAFFLLLSLPGPRLTGFAQVRRGYETPMTEKLAHDLEWIADRSVRLYVRTLASTAWRVLGQSLRGIVNPRA